MLGNASGKQFIQWLRLAHSIESAMLRSRADRSQKLSCGQERTGGPKPKAKRELAAHQVQPAKKKNDNGRLPKKEEDLREH
jgi:hypothetical protein